MISSAVSQRGGGEISSERRAEIQKFIAELNARVARVEVSTSVTGAEVGVDDALAGKSPLSRLLAVNPGRRKISVSMDGYAPAYKFINAVPGDSVRVELEPTSLFVRVEVPRKDTTRTTWMTVGWASTALLATGGVVMGVLAHGASNDLNASLDQPNQSRSSLDSQRGKVRTLDVLADVFAVAAVGTGAASLYLTLKKPSRETTIAGHPAGVHLRVAPAWTGLDATF